MPIIPEIDWVSLVQAYNVFKFWNRGFSYCFPVTVQFQCYSVMKNKISAVKVFHMRGCSFMLLWQPRRYMRTEEGLMLVLWDLEGIGGRAE